MLIRIGKIERKLMALCAGCELHLQISKRSSDTTGCPVKFYESELQ